MSEETNVEIAARALRAAIKEREESTDVVDCVCEGLLKAALMAVEEVKETRA